MLKALAVAIEQCLKQKTPIRWTGGHDSLVQELAKVMTDFPEKPAGTEVTFAPPEQYSKVILVSGGMDSSIMWWLNRDISDKLGLYVNLGHQYTQQELNSLQRIVGDDEKLKVVDYPLDFGGEWKHIIPTRNFVLIAIAEQFCKHEGEIWIGAVEGESAVDKGDKSELFFRMVEELVWRTKHKKIYIKDLKAKTKNDWLKMYLDATDDKKILETITCFEGFDPDEKGCGKCQACFRKWIALKYCKIAHVNSYFLTDPYEGGQEFVKKYKVKMKEALDKGDFAHYSKNRCIQDLGVITEHEDSITTAV